MLSRRRFATLCASALAVSGCGIGRPAALPPPTPTPEPETRVSGSGTAMPLVQKLAEAHAAAHPAARFQMDAGTNSGGAIKGVLQGALDVAATNRPLSEAEAREPLRYVPFARDAVAFAARLSTDHPAISTAQIRDIYGGTVTNWSQVGQPAGPLIVLDRDEDESMRKLVLLPLLDGRSIRARAVVLTRAKDMLDSLANTPNSFGYSSLALLRMQRSEAVRVLALDGILPTADAVAEGAYRWHLTFGLVCRADAPPSVQRFVDFARSREAAHLLEVHDVAPAAR